MDAFESWKNEGKSIYPDLDLCDYCGAAFLAGREHQRGVDEPYMRHKDDCKMQGATMAYRHPRNCDCGLYKILKGGEGEIEDG